MNMQNQLLKTASSRMQCIHHMIERGMLQSISIPEKKKGAGRVTLKRRTPDLRLSESKQYRHLPKIYEVLSSIQKENAAYYCGFDPTADSLHLGHMTVLSVLLNLAKHGSRIVALIGGATAQLGDPEGKTEDRVRISETQLNTNSVALEHQITHIFRRYAERYKVDAASFSVLNNKHWYEDMTTDKYIDAIATQFKLTDMFQRDVVSSRLQHTDSDMRFSEFVYQTLQSFDWLHLYKEYGCAVQVGGNDQLGNIEDGYDYIYKCFNTPLPLAGITVPLVVTENGEKLGKSCSNAVWLDQTKSGTVSVEQYLVNLSSADLLSVSQKLTHHPLDELQRASTGVLAEMIMEEIIPLLT